jgi:hypothetical protein
LKILAFSDNFSPRASFNRDNPAILSNRPKLFQKKSDALSFSKRPDFLFSLHYTPTAARRKAAQRPFRPFSQKNAPA